MSKINKCFCGSGREHSKCHGNIKINSKFAKTYKFYRKIDNEMNKTLNEKNNKIVCKKGCSECCYQLFSISEIEFCIIVDYITKNFTKLQLEHILKQSVELKKLLSENYPEYINKLNINITGMSPEKYIYYVNDYINKLPIGCMFLNHRGECSIYKVRPIICRIHGVAYLHHNYNNVLCSKISINEENKNNFVDLTSYKDEYEGMFTFNNKEKGSIIIRRVYPIFYWLSMIEDKKMAINDFKKTKLFQRYTEISEKECIDTF